MAAPLDDYKELVDAIARLTSVKSQRVREKRRWPDTPDNQALNAVLGTLTAEQRRVIADLIDSAFEEGIHSLLAYLQDEIALRKLRLTREGRELPVEPFGTELYYDWVCRRKGDEWPEPVGPGE